MLRIAAPLIVLGSVLFFCAAFAPLSFKAFTGTPESQAAAISAAPRSWVILNILFLAGAVLAAAGIVLHALSLAAGAPNSMLRTAAWVGAGLVAVGVLPWTVVVVRRIVTPSSHWAGVSDNLSWLFAAYVVLTLVGLMAYGYALSLAGFPAWLAWGATGLAALALAGYFIFGDMPPFVFYVITLVIGLVLLWRPVPPQP